MEKMTKAMKLAELLEFVQGVESEHIPFTISFDVAEFINHEVALLNKRNQAKAENKKPSKAQVENMALANRIFDFLVENAGTFFSGAEVSEKMELGLTSQKMVALMKKVVELGALKRPNTEGGATSNKKLVGYGIEKVEEEEVQGE